MARRHPPLPSLWLMTDERQGEQLLAAVRALPRGGGIVFRHHRTPPAPRRSLYEEVRRIARARRLVLVLAGAPRQAAAWRADGTHGKDGRRAGRPAIRTAPAHDRREVVAAMRAGADVVFLSPLFPTRSHPGARTLGRVRFGLAHRGLRVGIVALGGVDGPVDLPGVGGWAAIDALTPRR